MPIAYVKLELRREMAQSLMPVTGLLTVDCRKCLLSSTPCLCWLPLRGSPPALASV
jgi:hypothetical protein